MVDLKKVNKNEHLEPAGQTAVLFALLIIGLLAFLALAIDGGNTLNERRITQNAADASAMTGVRVIVAWDSPTEQILLEEVHSIIESHGIPDTDGTLGNDVNGNVEVYYTDANGKYLTGSCDQTAPVPCYPDDADGFDRIPPPARGVRVFVNNEFDTFFAGIIGQNEVSVGAQAVAVAQGGNVNTDEIADNVLVAFGDGCTPEDKPLDISAWNIDFIGGVHTNNYGYNRGDDNHYHGTVTYGTAFTDTTQATSHPAIYETAPAPGDPVSDPFSDLSVSDFDCTNGDPDVLMGGTCYDLSSTPHLDGGEITKKTLVDEGLYDEGSKELLEGIYYGGGYPFSIGDKGMHGNVTLVTSSYIKTKDEDIQLTAYLKDGDAANMLMFSSYTPSGGACMQHEDGIVSIDTTSSKGKVRPGVWHNDDKPECVDPAENCYVRGSNFFEGILYAPNGRVATSGEASTYIGAIIANAIRINGGHNRSEGGGPAHDPQPDTVGGLFVNNAQSYPANELRIFLDE